MPLFISSVASGSNGNCYYIGNGREAILVDAGISCRETEKRMARQGLSMQQVKAIFVSHEHTDHIRGLSVLANKYQLPVFLSDGTRAGCRLAIPDRLLHPLADLQTVTVADLEITSFRKFHDAADPHSFLINSGGYTVGVFTDIGRVCERMVDYFSRCDAAFLEANYDVDMLMQGRYPFFLKNRIRSGYGHLSNTEALELFRQYRSPKLSHLFLSHLSRDNNDPELVHNLFNEHRGDTEIIVAGRYAETPVYRLGDKPTLMRSEWNIQIEVTHGYIST
ncbi:MBL fold metallo-hydrolase [Parapedobacter indicus]|uniref:Phosphoribosyl 1,2-cyclic phosphodiesterase n=1 Tax=Parapedobacter indicus TaxID=1477437 RepID=A0A1I3Q678_9SPHI|nr:MBL fold metallo-hydrolase [Parapedobacter indicus]PPL00669.1 phosphoribosyl 1,2-cyclic phosphodiesterase [Parapedobacter indicus]SFJ28636.1 Phosphoribosyl 1,2-cyclic phosphodiesterase [Parapedobacter indicus]